MTYELPEQSARRRGAESSSAALARNPRAIAMGKNGARTPSPILRLSASMSSILSGSFAGAGA
jgi:hypothetical protein